MSEKPDALRLADELSRAWQPTAQQAAVELRRLHAENEALRAQRDALLEALRTAEAGLSDIGDADREPGDDVAWCEARAAQAIPQVRAAIAKAEPAE